MRLFVFGFELLHEVDERFHAFDGHCVVDGRTHTARKTVTFQRHKTVLFSFLDEFRVEVGGGSDERYVHHRPVFGVDLVGVEVGVVDKVVKHCRFFAVDFFHCGDAAHLFEITHVEHHHVNRPAGRSVVKAVVLCLRGVFEHGGANVHFAAEEFLFDDDERNACGSEVFLCACVNERVFVDVRDFTHDAGRHIGNEGCSAVGGVVPLGAENGIVFGDVDIIDIVSEILAGNLGDIGEVFVFGGGDEADISVFAGFFVSLFGEVARDDVVGATFLQKVERHGFELGGSSALNKQNVVRVVDVHEFADQSDAFVVNGFVDLAAMAELHNAHAASFIVGDLLSGFLQHFEREHTGTGGKVVNSHKAS